MIKERILQFDNHENVIPTSDGSKGGAKDAQPSSRCIMYKHPPFINSPYLIWACYGFCMEFDVMVT